MAKKKKFFLGFMLSEIFLLERESPSPPRLSENPLAFAK